MEDPEQHLLLVRHPHDGSQIDPLSGLDSGAPGVPLDYSLLETLTISLSAAARCACYGEILASESRLQILVVEDLAEALAKADTS